MVDESAVGSVCLSVCLFLFYLFVLRGEGGEGGQ